jgi:hypothetical protein
MLAIDGEYLSLFFQAERTDGRFTGRDDAEMAFGASHFTGPTPGAKARVEYQRGMIGFRSFRIAVRQSFIGIQHNSIL